jgi:tetratricopeptide (TPR) repeat protein
MRYYFCRYFLHKDEKSNNNKKMKKSILTLSISLFITAISFAQNADVAKSDAIGAEFQEQYAKAAEAFAKAAEAYTTEKNIIDTFCVYHAGLNYYKVKQYEKAIPFIEKAISLNYKTISGTKMVADCYIKLKQNDKAESILLAAKEKYPANSIDFEKKLGYLYFNSGRYKESANSFKIINEQIPGKKSYMYLYGFSLERMKKYEDAIVIFRDLNSKFPTYKNGNRMLGITLFEYADSQNKLAVEKYNKIKDQSLDDYIVTKRKIEKINKTYEEARIILETSHKEKPNDKQVINALYKIYKKQSKNTKAAEMQKLLK